MIRLSVISFLLSVMGPGSMIQKTTENLAPVVLGRKNLNPAAEVRFQAAVF